MCRNKLENIVGALVLTLSDAMLKAAQSEAPKNISAAGITLVGHVPGISIQELSHGLGLSHPGTVRLVDRMVAEGIVQRGRSETDGRTVALTLTAKGKGQERKILSARCQVLSEAMSSLSGEEHIAFAQISEKLVKAILKDKAHALEICRLCDSKVCGGCPVDAELLKRSKA